MPTLDPDFVTAVNRNGVKQYIPRHWLDPDSPFADQFRLPPSARKATAEKPAKQAASTKKPRQSGGSKEAPSWP